MSDSTPETVTSPDIAAQMKDALRASMNPVAMVAQRPPAIQIPAPPPPMAQVTPNRPMLPPPPMVQVPPNRMHAQIGMMGQQPPETAYARELREKAAGLLRPRLCDGCGGVRRINEVKDKRGQVVGFDPCPKCVEL